MIITAEHELQLNIWISSCKDHSVLVYNFYDSLIVALAVKCSYLLSTS